MGKINKEFQWRMQGILHAREVVKKDGLDGLIKKLRCVVFCKHRWYTAKVRLMVGGMNYQRTYMPQ